MTASPNHAARSVLIVEQGFLKDRGSAPARGVELFRLNLIRDLAERDIHMSVVATRSWARLVREMMAVARAESADRVRIIEVPRLGRAVGGGLAGVWLARRLMPAGGFDALIFGNARMGLAPAMLASSILGLARRTLLFAHRKPGARFLDAVTTVGFRVVANSRMIADEYRGLTPGGIDVCYGLTGGERYHPGPRQEAAARGEDPPDGVVRFCLLARLPNNSKGLEVALAAWDLLPATVRNRCHLHLASWSSPPDLGRDGVTAHAWIANERVPEFLRGMDAMLCISTYETFSQAMVQGMLTGLPVIATALPVYVEKIGADGSRGGIVCSGSAEIARAMERVSGDVRMRARLGSAGREEALARWVWDADRFIERHLFV